MEKEKAVVVAEMLKSFGSALVGICFVSMGATYFEEQLVYNVPRVLSPVFDLFGNIGLAIGMVVLGIGFIVYGFFKWKRVSAKIALYPIIIAIALILGLYLALYTGAFKDRSEREMGREEERQNELIDKVRNMSKPDFGNEKIESYLSEFDELLREFEEGIKSGEEQTVMEIEDMRSEWQNRSLEMFEELSSDEDKAALAAYMAQLALKWEDARQKAVMN